MGPRIRARARYFPVLGDLTRLRLLEALLEGPHSLRADGSRQCAAEPRLEPPRLLEVCGLAAAERRGREVVYRITDPRVRQALELSGALSEEH